ncbi:chromosomal replication initiator protein [Elusimicrobium simillimum]|uniref:DnaA ATPase domain-containing protein n=1 Tax=Elusimicrobium simillimum TaxID=3143438 RepID=UPI003C705B98
MIEKWDIKNVEGVMVLFLQGNMTDAKLAAKKLQGFSKDPVQTSIPPYNYRLDLTAYDPDSLSKIKIAIAEVVEQSKKVIPFTPANLENAAAGKKEDPLELTGIEIARDEEYNPFADRTQLDQITSFDLNLEGLGLVSVKDDKPVEKESVPTTEIFDQKSLFIDDRPPVPVQEEEPDTEYDVNYDFDEQDKTEAAGIGEDTLNTAGKMDNITNTAPGSESDLSPKIDAILGKVNAGRQNRAVKLGDDDDAVPLKAEKGASLEDILAAKTVLDMYATTGLDQAPLQPGEDKKDEGKNVEEIFLNDAAKTTFNVFDGSAAPKDPRAEEHAVDPFDLIFSQAAEKEREKNVVKKTVSVDSEEAGHAQQKEEPKPQEPAAEEAKTVEAPAEEKEEEPAKEKIEESSAPEVKEEPAEEEPKKADAPQTVEDAAALQAAEAEKTKATFLNPFDSFEEIESGSMEDQDFFEKFQKGYESDLSKNKEDESPARPAPAVEVKEDENDYTRQLLKGDINDAPAERGENLLESAAPEETVDYENVEDAHIENENTARIARTFLEETLKTVTGPQHLDLDADGVVDGAPGLSTTLGANTPPPPSEENTLHEKSELKMDLSTTLGLSMPPPESIDTSGGPAEDQPPGNDGPEKEEITTETTKEAENQKGDVSLNGDEKMEENKDILNSDEQNILEDNADEFVVEPPAPAEGKCGIPQPPAAPEAPAPSAPAAPKVEEAKPLPPVQPVIEAEDVSEQEPSKPAPPPISVEEAEPAAAVPPPPAVTPAAPVAPAPKATAAPKPAGPVAPPPPAASAPNANALKTQHSFYGARKAEQSKIDHSIELADREKHNWPLEVPLVPTFTFESMVTGANRFAHATAISVIDNPGNLYNPLVLHGGTGTGKTHFLNAIGYALSKKYGQKNIFMTNGVRFSRGIQRYVVEGKIEQFEEFIKSVKAILIDDIHLTAVNEQNREYISKFLNGFLAANKQIVITSKYPPESLLKLEELIDFKLDAGWISELKVATGANHAKIVKKMLSDNDIELTDTDNEKFFRGMSLSVISRTIKRAKVLSNVLSTEGRVPPPYPVLFEKLLAVSGEDVESAISVKDFSQVTQVPNFGRGEWGKIGFFYPQDNSNMMKWMAYSTGERAKELGIKGSYELALKSSYNPASIISSAFKIANICDNKKLKGAVILGPSVDVCDPSVRENFYDILTHMLEIMLIRCGIINFEKIKAPSTYVKVIAELLK